MWQSSSTSSKGKRSVHREISSWGFRSGSFQSVSPRGQAKRHGCDFAYKADPAPPASYSAYACATTLQIKSWEYIGQGLYKSTDTRRLTLNPRGGPGLGTRLLYTNRTRNRARTNQIHASLLNRRSPAQPT